jgi:hypothetical protein
MNIVMVHEQATFLCFVLCIIHVERFSYWYRMSNLCISVTRVSTIIALCPQVIFRS